MLDLTKRTIDSCSSSISHKYNQLRNSVTSFTDTLTPCCHYTKSKKKQNTVGTSMEQMKTLESLHFGDLERPQVSKYHIQKPRFNVYVFKAKCSSFYLNKSSNTADTTAYDTFCTENPSVR